MVVFAGQWCAVGGALGLELVQIGARLETLCPGGIGARTGVWLRAVGCVWAVVVLWIAGTGTAAASGWAIQSVPADSGGLGAVSCTSDSACMTIGARWNGRQWSKLPSPPAGAGLSCTSRTACIAVGSCYCSGFHTPVAARWNGREWSLQRTPHRARADTVLNAVSCTSPSACTAVGYGPPGPGLVPAGDEQGVFVERFDGRRWSTQTAPTPAWANGALLNGVSCVSLTLCTAVGSSVGGPFDAFTRPLIERWNGRRWAIQRTPRPAGSSLTELSSVSCTSSTACAAVGDADGSTLVERWSAGSWSIQPSPNNGSAESNTLTSVSCATATVCTAVGATNLDAQGSTPAPLGALAERWNGRHWSLQHLVTQPGGSWLNAIACAARNSCVAVGARNGGDALLVRYS
jgi:hypothetical protein